jgi:pimeloyl-ACP methyl ester carboxylesterase
VPFVETPYGRIFYVRRGTAAAAAVPFLFIHGAGGNALLWGAVMNRLAGIGSVALDLPGHGRSTGPGQASIAAYAGAVAALADALGLGEAVLVGHSMGGGIALHLALSQPARVRGLVLLSTTARLFVAPGLLQQLVDDPAAARRWIVEMGYGPQTTRRMLDLGTAQLARVDPAVLHGDFVACSAFDVRPRLAEVRAPALVACGAEDRLTPPKYVRALAEGLANARFELIPAAGHMLPMEAPAAVAELVLGFLRGQEAWPATPPGPGRWPPRA